MKKVLMILAAVALLAGMAWADTVNESEPFKASDDSFLSADGPAYSGGDMLLGGGPDNFGYVWRDSRDAGGPVFNWIDISGIGTEITPWPHGSVDDGYTDLIPMGITFNYYGIDYSSVSISTNGWLSFVAVSSAYLSNAVIPNTALPNPVVAPLWDDLDGGTVGHVYYYSDVAENRFIVSWLNWPYYPDPTDPKDFQVILDADDSSLVFQYGNGTFSQADITVGIENETGTIGLQVANAYNYPSNNLVTKFTRPPFEAHNVGVNLITSPGATTYKDTSTVVSCNVRNFGTNTETNFSVTYQIFDSTGAIVYNNSVTVPSIDPLTDYVATFPNWTPAEGNRHSLKAYTSLGTDTDHFNDTTRATTNTLMHRGVGGPVEYWSFADNITGGGPAFDWVDITGVGEAVTFSSSDNANSGLADMGMTFNFFGTTYSQLAISTNGWMSFTDGSTTGSSNTVMPSSGSPNTIIALLWDDLHLGTGTVYRYYDSANNRYIVQYNNVEFYSSGGPDCIDMEVILDADDNSIKMQYNNFCDSSQADITIGIENSTGTVGLPYDNSGERLQTPYDGVAVTFTFNPPTNDVGVNAILSPGAASLAGFPQPVSARVQNYGDAAQVSVPVRFTILDSTGAIAYNQTTTIPNLAPYTTEVATFPDWTPAFGGPYTLQAMTYMAGDFNVHNDTTLGTTRAYPHRSSDGPVEDWSYIDNLGGGPAFNWIDITTVGDSITFGSRDDSNSGFIDMGMTFSFFGTVFSSVAVSTNGWLSFSDASSTALTNTSIPTTTVPNDLVALLWDDLHLGTGTVYYYHDVANNRFIVQYYNIEFYSSGGPDCIDMEVIFDGTDNTITMQYNTFCTGSQTDVTIGIENSTGTAGLAYDNNGEFGQTPIEGLAITYTYAPPAHNVGVNRLISPLGILNYSATYDIEVEVINAGSNAETFQVTASDDHGYSNTQTVTDLASFGTATVIFPNWNIGINCTPYRLQVVTNLAGDEFPGNDSLVTVFNPMPAYTASVVYDDGIGNNAWRYLPPSYIIANKFDIPYSGAPLSGIAYKFTGDDLYPEWPDANRDSVKVFIHIDSDLDGIPDTQILEDTIQVANNGFTVWPIDCFTDLTFSCQSFWAGWAQYDSLKPEGIALDAATDYPQNKWAYTSTGWALNSSYAGDNIIRAYYVATPGTNADIAIGSLSLTGNAPAGGSDQASTTLDNAGTGCDLTYQVRVSQNVALASHRNQPQPIITPGIDISQSASMFGLPASDSKDLETSDYIIVKNEKGTFVEQQNPPVTLSQGGPDLYGYTWIDSDEPGGPVFSWIDITGIGTEITPWPHGTVDDGYTDPIPMGMNFPFYGVTYTDIVVSTNGWVSFLPQTNSYLSNAVIPTAANPNAIIAVEWDDQDGGTVGHCYYYFDSANNQFIVSWVGWPYYPDGTGPAHDFQVILKTDGDIITQYANNPGEYQTDVTVGIENETGTDGLQVANNQVYLHNDMAIHYIAPTLWLSTDLVNGTLAPNDPPLTFNANMSAAELEDGTYEGAIIITSNDLDEPVSTISVIFTVGGGGGGCQYVVGDINNNGALNGIDVTYGVGYFKGGPVPPYSCECTPGNTWYVGGDVNGSCVFNGIDITYLVGYFKGGPSPIPCGNCPPTLQVSPAPSTPALAPTQIKVQESQQ